jgi:hypothetical protein
MINEGQACDGLVKKPAFFTPRPFVRFSFEIEIYVRNHLRERKGNARHCDPTTRQETAADLSSALTSQGMVELQEKMLGKPGH